MLEKSSLHLPQTNTVIQLARMALLRYRATITIASARILFSDKPLQPRWKLIADNTEAALLESERLLKACAEDTTDGYLRLEQVELLGEVASACAHMTKCLLDAEREISSFVK